MDMQFFYYHIYHCRGRLWRSRALNSPRNGEGYAYGPKAGKDEFGSYQPFANLYVGYASKNSLN